MIFRSLDSNKDWRFGGGKSSYTKTGEAIRLNLETTIKTFKGECFFDQNRGLPWFDLINITDKAAVVLYIKSIMIKLYGVTKVNALEYTVDINRVFTIKYDISTLYETNLLGTVVI